MQKGGSQGPTRGYEPCGEQTPSQRRIVGRVLSSDDLVSFSGVDAGKHSSSPPPVPVPFPRSLHLLL